MGDNKCSVYTSLEELIRFFEGKRRYYLDKFNYSPEENKSDKWRLLRAEKALKLLAENPDYKLGQCIQCGEEIPAERIMTEPESIWCIDCVQLHEKLTSHKGGHWSIPQISNSRDRKAEKIAAIEGLLNFLGKVNLTDFGKSTPHGFKFSEKTMNFPEVNNFPRLRTFLLTIKLAELASHQVAMEGSLIMIVLPENYDEMIKTLDKNFGTDWPYGVHFVIKNKDWQTILLKEIMSVNRYSYLGGHIERAWAKIMLGNTQLDAPAR